MNSERRSRLNRIRRQRQLRRRLALAAFAAAFFLTAGVFACGVTVSAQGEGAAERKYFTSIMIMPGDTLSSIAAAYADGHYGSAADYIAEVCETNHILNENAIEAGSYLVIPYYR